MTQQLTFRERQLIASFRRCDERGRAFVEQAAVNQAEFSRASARPIAVLEHLMLVKSGGGERHG